MSLEILGTALTNSTKVYDCTQSQSFRAFSILLIFPFDIHLIVLRFEAALGEGKHDNCRLDVSRPHQTQ